MLLAVGKHSCNEYLEAWAVIFNRDTRLCRGELGEQRGEGPRGGPRGVRDLVSRTVADELLAVRLVPSQLHGDKHRPEEHEDPSAVPLRRLRQSLHADGQPEASPDQVRRLLGEAAGRS